MDAKFKEKCDEHRIIYTKRKHIKKFQSLLTYSDEMIDSFFSRLEPENDIKDLIHLFKIVKSRENSLSQLTDGKPVTDLGKMISLLELECCIRAEFPKWDYELAAEIPKHLLVDLDKKYFSNVSTHESFSKYSGVFPEYKESLNETFDSEYNNLFLQKLLYDLNLTFMKLTSTLDSLEEIKEKLEVFIKSLDSENKIIELINALEILIEWNVNVLESKAFEIISNSTEVDVRQNIHNFVLSEYFSKTYEKSLDELIDELLESNPGGDIKLLKNRSDLKTDYQKVMRASDGESSLDVEGPIKSWDKSQIAVWSRFLKLSRIVKYHHDMTLSVGAKALLFKTLEDAFPSTSEPHDSAEAQRFSNHVTTSVTKYERLAVIIRTAELTTGIKLREVQILSIILLLDSKMNKGRLAQINTGEGKTMIVAALAAYHVLNGRKVDVITSSELLVYPQLNKLEAFYESLGISVSHNFGPSSAYFLDVVYGTSREFQGDILTDEFKKLKKRHGRKCDVAIVDEVDNMLIDGNSGMVFLSCAMPGMDYLETLLAVISIQIKTVAAALRVEDGQMYFVQCENAIDENGEIKDEIIENYIPIDVSPYEFKMKATDSHLRKLIRDCDESELGELASNYPEIKIPKHLRELITDVQLESWIDKAILVNAGFVDKEYYILDKEVKIVDAENTGVVEDNMHWTDGVHQFIQIKHGAALTPESFTTNYISNVSYFRRYKDIYGLTGTLGCQKTREFLENIYSVDSVILPPFKLKLHQELKAIVVENEEDWLREIVKNSLRKLINGRAILIITKYIRLIEAIENIFINDFSYDKNHLKLYKTNGDSDVINESLDPRDVLITTNIAGRGTDIRVHKDVEKNGGLHVCLTFLPKNSRVEEQNIGRTSRTGNRGTSQFILNNEEKDIMILRGQRSQKEESALSNALGEIERVTIKDDIFHEFCKLTNVIGGRNEFVKETERKAVEERFGIWLKMNEGKFTSESRSEMLRLFGAFRREILEDEESGKLVKNPYMFVEIGNKYLKRKEYVKAIEEYTLAIELDSNFAEHAHFNRACAYIAQYGGDLVGNADEIDEAITDFQKSRELIEVKEHNLHLMQNASEGAIYSRQISHKLNLYNIRKNAIERAIGVDEEAIRRSVEDLRNRQSRTERDSDNWRRMEEVIEDLEERMENAGVIQEAQDNGNELSIEFVAWEEIVPTADDSHNEEIEEFERNGANGSFTISEVPPIDWTSVIGLLLLGFGQLIAGAALTVFTLGGGASFGTALMAEGISDIITAVKDGIINRNFSWARWAIEKAISLTVSVVCVGWNAMKDVARTIKGGAKIVTGLGTRAVPQAVKEGWKLVFRKVGGELVKAAAKEFVVGLANYGIGETLVPWLQRRIVENVEGLIGEALKKNRNVTMMLELDKRENNTKYEDRIRKIGLDLINPKESSKISDFLKLAQKLSNRAIELRCPEHATSWKVHVIKMNMTKALVELPNIVPKFLKDFDKALEKMVDDERVEERYEDQEESRIRGDVSSDVESNGEGVDSELDVERSGDEEEQVQPQHSDNGALRIAKNLSDSIAKVAVSVIQRDIVAPVVQLGATLSVKQIMANETKILNGYIETFKDRRRVVQMMEQEFEADEGVEEQNTD